MLPDEMEAEKNRKIILSMTDEIEILKKNIADLQEQLQNAYKRIEELNRLNQEWIMDYNTEGKLQAAEHDLIMYKGTHLERDLYDGN